MAEATDLFVLKTWLENRGLDVVMRPHPMAEGATKIRARAATDPTLLPVAESCERIMSTHQLFVSGPRGVISVVRGGLSLGKYEIYCIEGDLFDDIGRYDDVKTAGLVIHTVLCAGGFLVEPDDANQSGEP